MVAERQQLRIKVERGDAYRKGITKVKARHTDYDGGPSPMLKENSNDSTHLTPPQAVNGSTTTLTKSVARTTLYAMVESGK